ncbi:hypothetical protein A3D06_01245 [Candidatus Roizmanbacteria bacterium RIFCSPHIGHO2_02_FULL_40_9]|uniref:Asn/Gln amidotransferase domain-containing protein n=1 Tax=Candidatus Roizmanbacteria bacterium RIFCSPHIGHO2_02_FULL_40_9 TaxID=1802042 RepID=A0A1F7HEF4_9BACT|nr:MAG: hypothetical protein A3D06_01245 [Candidatus Roizmanbacteria bacterium RIFCSPHIGHO2_02_FULL_40_9]
MLRSKIQGDMTTALKDRNQTRLDALRLFWSELKNEEINTKKELTDEDILRLLKKHVKKIQEAAEMFQKGDRNDLYEENASQIMILSAYLPAQLSEEELKKEIEKIITDNRDLYDKNAKAIIGIVMKELSSKADSKKILEILNTFEK